MKSSALKFLTVTALGLFLNGLDQSAALAAANEAPTQIEKLPQVRDSLPQHLVDTLVVVTVAVTGAGVLLGTGLSLKDQQKSKSSSPKSQPKSDPQKTVNSHSSIPSHQNLEKELASLNSNHKFDQ